jgi:predicted signal transduction protein with EAL and GGDEF domain
VYPEHGQDPSQLLRTADAAMCVAKREGSGFAVYRGENEPRDVVPDFMRASLAAH